MLKQFVILVVTICCVAANLNFQDCGSSADVHALRIAGCASTPCTFRRGDTYLIELDVTARSSSINLPFEIQGIIPILPPITVMSGNACTTLIVGNCPAISGNFFTSRIAYTVGNLLPAISLPVRFLVRDDFNQTVVCGQIPVTITG